jgi:hypothetical protein
VVLQFVLDMLEDELEEYYPDDPIVEKDICEDNEWRESKPIELKMH